MKNAHKRSCVKGKMETGTAESCCGSGHDGFAGRCGMAEDSHKRFRADGGGMGRRKCEEFANVVAGGGYDLSRGKS